MFHRDKNIYSELSLGPTLWHNVILFKHIVTSFQFYKWGNGLCEIQQLA